jgi:hypothetical protein
MLSSETFNTISNGSAFNHHVFGEISRPVNDAVINLSSEEEEEEVIDEFEALTNQRKRQHHSTENLNGHNNKRKHKESINLYNDSQKNRNRNVPLKKRGASNREEELNFLNLIANEDSNHAQNTKIVSSRDLLATTTCDSTNTTNQKFYHELEPKERSSSSNDHNKSIRKRNTENNSICNCLECFPNLGSDSLASSHVKCKKLLKPDMSSSSSINNSLMTTKNSPSTSSSFGSDLSLIPGPSGIQRPIKSSIVAKEPKFTDSDDDYDSDEQQLPQSEGVKTDDLTAPHLQLDWSDSSDEDDDDVIFVNDRSEPIDLTADSDIETENKTQSSIDASKKSIDKRSIGERNSENRSNTSMNYHSLWPPPSLNPSARSISPRNSVINHQRPPIISQPANTIILPTPPIIPPPTIMPSSTSRQINFQEVITGNDVMLFEGAQNFSTHSSRARITLPLSTNESRQENVSNQIRESNQNCHHSNSISSTNNNHNINHRRNTHHHPTNSYHTQSSHHVEDLTTQSNNVHQSPAQQNSRGVGRCPFLTEGHHYNRPSRRLAREFYPISNGRPYAIHEDLWRRQYQEQEIRRHYWSTAGFNETPEVQVHMVHMEPSSSIPHRLVTNMGDNSTNNNSTNDILNRYRMQRFHRRSWYFILFSINCNYCLHLSLSRISGIHKMKATITTFIISRLIYTITCIIQSHKQLLMSICQLG